MQLVIAAAHKGPVISGGFAFLGLEGRGLHRSWWSEATLKALRTYLPVRSWRMTSMNGSQNIPAAGHKPLMHEFARLLSTASNGRFAATARGDSSILSSKTYGKRTLVKGLNTWAGYNAPCEPPSVPFFFGRKCPVIDIE